MLCFGHSYGLHTGTKHDKISNGRVIIWFVQHSHAPYMCSWKVMHVKEEEERKQTN